MSVFAFVDVQGLRMLPYPVTVVTFLLGFKSLDHIDHERGSIINFWSLWANLAAFTSIALRSGRTGVSFLANVALRARGSNELTRSYDRVVSLA